MLNVMISAPESTSKVITLDFLIINKFLNKNTVFVNKEKINNTKKNADIT